MCSGRPWTESARRSQVAIRDAYREQHGPDWRPSRAVSEQPIVDGVRVPRTTAGERSRAAIEAAYREQYGSDWKPGGVAEPGIFNALFWSALAAYWVVNALASDDSVDWVLGALWVLTASAHIGRYVCSRRREGSL